ncbi:MAG: 30S ribosomal protein S2 [Candidatus Peribacteraceae bacterium]|nr:30S ribosomal protein S2 [Candidatus Peribacteraceae bacterium]
MPIPTEKDLIAASCHVGHRKEKWNPKMAPYLFGIRKGIHIFDLTETRKRLENVCAQMRQLQAEGKAVLFVSTKQQSISFIEKAGKELDQPTVTKKWIPGLLTNWPTIKRRLKYYLELQQSFQTGEVEKYTKKEQLTLRKKLAKLDAALSGVAGMTQLPDAVFVVDAVRDRVAVLEAKKLSIPLFGICDSIADPDLFTAFIPCNDDAVKALTLVIETVINEMKAAPSKRASAQD